MPAVESLGSNMANDAPSNSAAARVAASNALAKNGTIQTPESLAAMISQMQQGPDDSMMGNFNPDTMKRIPPQAEATMPNPDDEMRELIKTPPGAAIPSGGGNGAGNISPGAGDQIPQLRPGTDPLMALLAHRGMPAQHGDVKPIDPSVAAVRANIAQRGVRGYTPDANNNATATEGSHPLAMGATGLGLMAAPALAEEGVPMLLRGMLPRALGGEAAASGGAEAGGAAVGAGGEAAGAEVGGNAENALREIVNNPTPENVTQVAKQWPEDVQKLIDDGHISPDAYEGTGLKPALDSPGYKAWRMFRTQMGRGGKGSATPDYLSQISE